MPTVSVIVPVYNVEEYLPRCIDSVLNQTYRDFELILVDDGSPDNCGTICDEYAAKDLRIRVIHKKNGGVAAARNSALDIAQGQYIAFCDSDDIWDTTLLQTAIQALATTNADIVHFNYREVENGQIVKAKHFLPGVFELAGSENKRNYLVSILLSHQHGWELWDRLFRRDIIEKHHIRCCTTSGNFGEDLSFVCKYLLHAQRVCCIEDCLYTYCRQPDSITKQSQEKVRLNDMNEVAYDVWLEYTKVFNCTRESNAFPILHLMFLNDQILRLGSRGLYPQLPEALEKMDRYRWWKQNIRNLLRSRKQLTYYFGVHCANRTVLFCTYLLHGNWKLYCLESALYHKFCKR